MKNRLLSIALIFSLSLLLAFNTSCKKDEETNQPDAPVNNIIGIWTINNSNVDLTVDGVDLVTYMTTNFEYTQQEAEVLAPL